MYVLDSYIR